MLILYSETIHMFLQFSQNSYIVWLNDYCTWLWKFGLLSLPTYQHLTYPLLVFCWFVVKHPLYWLLVGTPSAFGPELAYRLHVVQPTLMDVPIFLIYFYITLYVCVPHFYDLSALVGCWSSVSIRRIIYNFLNVCPFNYTAVAVSWKVERS